MRKNSDYYKLALNELMERSQQRNVSFDYDIKQTRDKFKRCVGICREAALKIKTASGIQRFQEEKEYGTWFSKLYSEQLIEPDAEPESPRSLYGAETSTAAASPSSTETRKRKLFVPIHETSKKKLKCREDTLYRLFLIQFKRHSQMTGQKNFVIKNCVFKSSFLLCIAPDIAESILLLLFNQDLLFSK